MRQALIFTAILLVHSTAFGYIGPGLGSGAIGVVLGILASIFLALFAIFWYPIKRLIKAVRGGSNDKKTQPKDPEQQPEQDP